jgi:membrane-bound serine protease (ClpP class)
MSPGTNIGAAHPVTIGGGGFPGGGKPDTTSKSTMMEKITNDAVAYIRSIAEKRGRNADWAEEAVIKSVSVTETEALEKNIIDFISPSIDSLLRQLDGKTTKIRDVTTITLNTKDAQIREIPLGLRYKILNIISDPNIAYILMILGFYGLFFELSNPGSILPGVLGAIFLILAFFAFQVLPVNYAGLLLIILGVILFILEVKVTSYGMLTIGGIISMLFGSIMLIDTPEPLFRISWYVILSVVAFTALFFIAALSLALRAHQSKITTGMEGLIGMKGIAETRIREKGSVLVHGEIWNATSREPIPKGSNVVVVGYERMTLIVEKVNSKNKKE